MRSQITVSKDHPLFHVFGWKECGTYTVYNQDGSITTWGWSREYDGAGEVISNTCEPISILVPPPPRKSFWKRLFG
jgi:hypothetical protein